jgi:chorismate dehydratase
MTPRTVRLGAVSYLNVRPLVYGLDRHADRVTLRFDVPSTCARLLSEGAIDLGMVPSITYLDRPGDRVVAGMCIGSDGPVASVALFARRPIAEIRTIALDTSSRTSAALVKVLCARRFGISPAFIAHPPDLDAMLGQADAALLIGDQALFVDPRAHGATKLDLGAEWTAMTGLPFVWAFWSGPDSPAIPAILPLLGDAAVAGAAHAPEIAAAYCASTPERIPVAERYLKENLVFDLSARAIEGLRTYYREAVALGLAAGAPEITFF